MINKQIFKFNSKPFLYWTSNVYTITWESSYRFNFTHSCSCIYACTLRNTHTCLAELSVVLLLFFFHDWRRKKLIKQRIWQIARIFKVFINRSMVILLPFVIFLLRIFVRIEGNRRKARRKIKMNDEKFNRVSSCCNRR